MPLHDTSYALLVGIDAYRNDHVTPLLGASNDAKSLGETLVQNIGFSEDRVKLLCNEEAIHGNFGAEQNLEKPTESHPPQDHILRASVPLACATWPAMCGNGAPTGLRPHIMHTAHPKIRSTTG